MLCDVQINFKKCALVFGMKTLFCIEHLVYPGNEAMLKKTTNVEEVWNYFKIFGNISQYLEIFEDIIEYLDVDLEVGKFHFIDTCMSLNIIETIPFYNNYDTL